MNSDNSETGDDSSAPPLEQLLEKERDKLAGYLRRHGTGLLNYESVDDLVQGTVLEALKGEGGFAWQGEEAFRAWLFALARGQIAARNRHWKALKRRAGSVLRLSFAGSSSPGQEPALDRTGPLTFSDRREMVLKAMQALETLGERDRELVMGQAQGEELADQAERLGLTYEAAQRARLRALERFQLAFRVLGSAGD